MAGLSSALDERADRRGVELEDPVDLWVVGRPPGLGARQAPPQ
jgi:hypothetical protein